MSAANLLAHIKVLASDEFEGRAPGSPGEERTVAYLTEQFRTLGLQITHSVEGGDDDAS